MDGILPKGFPPPPLYGEWDSLQGGPLLFLQGFPFSKWIRFSSRGFLLHSEWDSLQGIPLLNSEWDSHQEGHPLQENGIRTKRVTLSKANGIRIKRVTLSKANGIRIKRVTLSKANGIRTKRVTLSKRMGFASRGSPSPKRMGFASNVGPSCSKRPLSRDSSPRPRYSRDSLSPKGFASASKRMIFASRDSHSPKQQRLSRGTQILLDDAFIPSFVS